MSKFKEIHAQLFRVAKQHHPCLASLIEANGVVQLKKPEDNDLFRFLARIITGQQLSKAAANTIWSRVEVLAEERGKPIIDICIKRNELRLRECGLSGNKVKALVGLNKAFAHGDVSYGQIAKGSYKDISCKIKQLWGLGQWSADMVAMFFLSHPDVWPSDDAALIRGMKTLIGEQDPSIVAQLYSPYRTYLAKHIWLGLDTGIIFEP